MIAYIKKAFPNPEAGDLNRAIMDRKYETPLQDHVLDCFQSIEDTLEQVKMVSHSFVTDFDEISITEYEQNRDKTIKPSQKVAYINDSRLGELIMTFEVDLSDEPVAHTDKWEMFLKQKMKDKAPANPLKLYYTVRELVPIADPIDGTYRLKGKRYISKYQISETTTYNTSNALVLKSIMGIKLEKRKIEVHDYENNTYVMNTWRTNLMNEMAPLMLFYLSEYGWIDTLEFFLIGKYVKMVNDEYRDPDWAYFPVGQNMWLSVIKKSLSSSYIQGLVGSLISVITPKTTWSDVMDREYWVSRIGATKKGTAKESHHEMGRRYRILFKRMLDTGSKKAYRLEDYNKRTVLHVIRWMVQEYASLRARDNLDMSFKRLRGNEYIANLITGIISERIRKFVHTTANTPEKLKAKYDNLFKYKGMEVISKLHKSGLAKDEDIVNDLDILQKFSATLKGPNALGNVNPRNITMRQRGLHFSHLGVVGISNCSSSDPGRTAELCPLAESDGLFFKDTPPEPEEFAFNFAHEMGEMTEWVRNDGTSVLAITNPTKLYRVLDCVEDIKIRTIGGPRIVKATIANN